MTTRGRLWFHVEFAGSVPGEAWHEHRRCRRGAGWWPIEIGTPTSEGAQYDLRHACFAAARGLAIHHGGRIGIHNTGDHRNSGVSQRNRPDRSIAFTPASTIPFGQPVFRWLPPTVKAMAKSPLTLGLSKRCEVVAAPAATVPLPDHQDQATTAEDDIFTPIERLAELRRSGILTEEEFIAREVGLLRQL